MIESRVKAVLTGLLGEDMSGVSTDSSLTDDLGVDSTELVEIVVALEAEFNVTISDEDAKAWRTVRDLCSAVESLAA